jgi:uncharacterized protein (TIGR02757 family)
MDKAQLREFLDRKAAQYNRPAFIPEDPIAVPHQYRDREDQEIAGFLTATIAWGRRPRIVASGHRMMALLDGAPAEFVRTHQPSDLQRLERFVHRTFQPADFRYFLSALQRLYREGDGLRGAFQGQDAGSAIIHFREAFFQPPHPLRTQKHVSDPRKNSACKRLNMFLRWMVRQDRQGVDLGLWDHLQPHQLSLPLDVHSARVARRLGLLQRRTTDWKAVREVDAALRRLDSQDPVRYDFALFGLGIFEAF